MHFIFSQARLWRHILLVPVAVIALLPNVPARAQDGIGSTDNGFTLGQADDIIGTRGIFAIAQQPDGKVLIGGAYDSILGQRGSFTRVNTDGSLDTTFNRPVIESYNTRTDSVITTTDSRYVPVIRVVRRQDDGKILVGGNFYFVNGVSGYGGLIRLNADGSVDDSFKAPRFTGSVYAVVPTTDGRYIVGGDFVGVDESQANCLVRLNANGELDDNFAPGTFSNSADEVPSVSAVAIQGDGKLIVGGLFAQIGGKSRPSLARLNPDGGLDNNYLTDGISDPLQIRADPVNRVFTIVLQADSKALVGGQIAGVGPGVVRNSLFRLDVNGNLDASFNPGGVGTNGAVNALLLDGSGRIIVGGDFTSFNATRRDFFMRLLPDGSLDTSFDSGIGANSTVFGLYLQSDGKLLISGYFRLVNRTTRIFVSRINTQPGSSPGVTVSIATTSRRAYRGNPSKNGVFLVSRSGGNLTVGLPVYYTLSGTAVGGLDYRPLSGTVIIPANQTRARIKVKPLSDPANTGRRKVVATLSLRSRSSLPLNGGYVIQGGGTGVVKVINTLPPVN